ncbi:hypothetical protein NH8B_0568 [Pseudogulbenkiania sp. NH8B]|uniref:hypothetical protein n=1 Tax=Pseudogulbenkiania sp. (strain NH8B) TaxID=748280 RepID=UPI0002279578|nr:hypothetical protein [Pseudogulbenkiania sp. NH8B]BAK75403.1 hypothetical protein NH8B_0568 [Pseudogulbenkiania sp. NH8B]
MIKEIDELLGQWSYWLARSEDGGTGWRGSSLNRAMAAACCEYPEAAQHAQIAEADLMSVERAVRREISPRSRRVVDTVYRGRGTYAQKAQDVGCSKSSLSAWVHNAHVEIAAALGMRSLVSRSAVMMNAGKNMAASNDMGY